MIDDAGMVKWNSLDSLPLDGTEVLLKTAIGVVSAWFHSEESFNDEQDDGHYEWVCYDDAFSIDGDGKETIKGWLPLSIF